MKALESCTTGYFVSMLENWGRGPVMRITREQKTRGCELYQRFRSPFNIDAGLGTVFKDRYTN